MALFKHKTKYKLSHTKPRNEATLRDSLVAKLWGFVLLIKQTITMKKTIVFGMFLGLLLPFSTFAAFDTNLKYGSTGSSVTELQDFLTSQGVYSGPVSGNFYTLTLQAVKAFQSKQGISPVSGYWGPMTRLKASSLISADLSASNSDEQTQTIKPINTPTLSPELQTKYDQLLNQYNSAQARSTIYQKAQQAAQSAMYSGINPLTPEQTQLMGGNYANLFRTQSTDSFQGQLNIFNASISATIQANNELMQNLSSEMQDIKNGINQIPATSPDKTISLLIPEIQYVGIDLSSVNIQGIGNYSPQPNTYVEGIPTNFSIYTKSIITGETITVTSDKSSRTSNILIPPILNSRVNLSWTPDFIGQGNIMFTDSQFGIIKTIPINVKGSIYGL